MKTSVALFSWEGLMALKKPSKGLLPTTQKESVKSVKTSSDIWRLETIYGTASYSSKEDALHAAARLGPEPRYYRIVWITSNGGTPYECDRCLGDRAFSSDLGYVECPCAHEQEVKHQHSKYGPDFHPYYRSNPVRSVEPKCGLKSSIDGAPR